MSLSLDKSDISTRIGKLTSIADLEALRISYLGKKGLITLEMKSLSSLNVEDKKIKGQKLNEFKNFLEKEL